MRYYMLSLILLVLGSPAFSKGIEFQDGTIWEAMDLAKSQNKVLFVDVYTAWCGPCKIMARNVFTLDEVGEYYNKNFINYKVDAEEDDGPDFVERYPVNAYPTFLFNSPDGKVKLSKEGSMSPEAFIRLAKTAVGEKIEGWVSYGELRAKYDNGDRSIELIRQLLLGAKEYSFDLKDDSEKENFDKWIQSVSSSYESQGELRDKISSDDFLIIYTYFLGQDINHPLVELVFDYYDEFSKVSGQQIVSRFITVMSAGTVDKLSKNGDKAYKSLIDDLSVNPAVQKSLSALSESDPFFRDYYSQTIQNADLEYFIATENWTDYAATSVSMIDDLGDTVNVGQLMRPVTRAIDAGCADVQSLSQLEPLAKKGYELAKDDADVCTAYARLLALVGKEREAKRMYKIAISNYDFTNPKHKKVIAQLNKERDSL